MQRTFVNPTPKADGKKFADLEITSLDTPSAEPDAIPATLGAWLKEETMNSALGQPPTQIPTGVFLRRIHINIERKRKIRLQHSMLRAAASGTCFGSQGNLRSTAFTKRGHVVSLHNCYGHLDEPTNCNDSKWSCRYSVGSRNPFR
jgi:hypothetical protein